VLVLALLWIVLLLVVRHPFTSDSLTRLTCPAENLGRSRRGKPSTEAVRPDVGAPTIFVEVDSGGLYPDRPTDLDRYTWVFGRLRELSLSPTATTALFSTLAAELNLGN
jgi:hypothetical protein